MKEKIMHSPEPSPLLVEFPAGVVQIGCRLFSFLHLDMLAVLELSFQRSHDLRASQSELSIQIFARANDRLNFDYCWKSHCLD